jgi:hypothetical protein
MERIGSQKIWTFYDDTMQSRPASNTAIRNGTGHSVQLFVELAKKVAELQFLNRDHVLLFRGQNTDYKNNKENTSLKPTLFRSLRPGKNPTSNMLQSRFEKLKEAERELVDRYAKKKLLGSERLKRHRILRWSILQHYGVCATPLLDVTHSLRIAASFASEDAINEVFVFVLGVPNLSGAITASSEAGLQIVRLSSACPPSAMRPHLQEGYLLGEYPEIADFEQKAHYRHFEMDFGRRLVAKFRFDPKTFWKSDTFPKVAEKALYPTGTRDPLQALILDLKNELGPSDP